MHNRTIVSVVMSIYNETEKEIQESINSILRQSFNDFEFIIVLDNPNRDFCFLGNFLKNDLRIKVIENESNLGLALSMNKAIGASKGKYIVRMDADDVSKTTRIEKQLQAISNNRFDVVCSLFEYIDENGAHLTELNSKSKYFSSENIEKELPYKNMIHHPTVMFTKRIFEKSGGYRNFPCSQDYDLWLRMLNNGAKFYMVPEILLEYRVRTNSISCDRLVAQKFTVEYIRKLFIERLLKGHDSFSPDNHSMYLKSTIRNEQRTRKQIVKGNEIIIKANKKNRIFCALTKLFVFLTNGAYRHLYFTLLLDKRTIKKQLKRKQCV